MLSFWCWNRLSYGPKSTCRTGMKVNMLKNKKSLCISVVLITTFAFTCYAQEKVLSVAIRDAPEGISKTFLVACQSRCKDVNATIKVDSGDPDLYASEIWPQKDYTSKCIWMIWINCWKSPPAGWSVNKVVLQIFPLTVTTSEHGRSVTVSRLSL